MTFHPASHAQFIALFDIDGTLVEKRFKDRPHSGIRALDHAGTLVLGVPDLTARIEFAGATDLGVARKMISAAGLNADSATIERLMDTYATLLPGFISDNPFISIGDSAAAIASVASEGGIVGLGTGNLRRTAFTKLTDARLDHLFHPERGGYGDDAENRAELLAIGAARCNGGRSLPLVIIGDTPRDIAAALELGAVAIGVPHDRTTASMLKQAGAHAVVPRLDAYLGKLISRLIVC